jgi:hypothetical protein
MADFIPRDARHEAIHGDSQHRRSPKFPTVNEATERRQQLRETIATRTLLVMAALFGAATPFAGRPFFVGLASGACLIGFVIMCFVAGNRWKHGGNGNGRRPF